jgi:cation:H+ antiporter
VEASLLGSPGIAVGNIVGSNITNILLILGIAAVIAPIAVHGNALRRDGSLVLATAAVFCAIGFVMPLGYFVGAVFLTGLATYVYCAYRQEMAGAPAGHSASFEKFEAHEELFDDHLGRAAGRAETPTVTALWIPLAMAFGGLAVVVIGGKLLVVGAIGFAQDIGISETVIGLTIVAIGTSLPELVTSVIAAIRRHGDMALGNILGSNIYNILAVAGVTALIAPTAIPPEIVRFDSLVMLAVSILLLVVARTGNRITRGEGAVLLACYGGYFYAIWPT